MPTKTITVTEDAYRLLKHQKRSGESFSQAIKRIFTGGSARGLVGIMGDEEAEEVRAGISQRRRRRASRRKRLSDAAALQRD